MLYICSFLWLAASFFFVSVTSRHCQHQNIPGDCDRDIHHMNSCKDEKSNTATRDIDQMLLDDIRLMAEYAAAAYWPGNNNSTDTPVSCTGYNCTHVPEGNCPRVEAAGARTTIEFKDTPKFDDHGELPLCHKSKALLLI